MDYAGGYYRGYGVAAVIKVQKTNTNEENHNIAGGKANDNKVEEYPAPQPSRAGFFNAGAYFKAKGYSLFLLVGKGVDNSGGFFWPEDVVVYLL